MTNSEFSHAQRHILRLNGRELAARLGTTPASVSRWADTQPIPPTVALLMDNLIAQALGTLTLPLMLPDLINLSRVAAARNISVEELLLELIRNATHRPPVLYTAPLEETSKTAETPPPAQEN
jgi:hypothetical protein